MVTVGRNWPDSHLLLPASASDRACTNLEYVAEQGAALYMLFLIVYPFPGSKRLKHFGFLVFINKLTSSSFVDSQEKRIFPL